MLQLPNNKQPRVGTGETEEFQHEISVVLLKPQTGKKSLYSQKNTAIPQGERKRSVTSFQEKLPHGAMLHKQQKAVKASENKNSSQS